MLPIYLKDQDFSQPEDTIYYLLARDGLFLVKRTPFFEATVPVPGIPWLAPQQPEVRLTAAPLPAAILLRAVAFFRAVFARYHTEAVTLLAWREATSTFELVVPRQSVGGGHCDYEVRDFPAGLTRLGTIHSHGEMEAFHSDRDDADERFEDGFHITVGNLGGELTLSCSVVVQGYRRQLPPEIMFTPFPIPWGQTPGEAEWSAVVDALVTPLPRPIEFGP